MVFLSTSELHFLLFMLSQSKLLGLITFGAAPVSTQHGCRCGIRVRFGQPTLGTSTKIGGESPDSFNVSVINTKAKVKLKKGIPFIKKFLCHPYTWISFLDSPQVLHTLSHNSSFITLFPGILIIFRQSPNSYQYMDPYPQILKNRSWGIRLLDQHSSPSNLDPNCCEIFDRISPFSMQLQHKLLTNTHCMWSYM